MMLSMEGVHAHYGHIHALRGIDVEVQVGEIVTLIGANGAGKSTLMMSLFGSPKASAGRIVFNGEDITRVPTHEIARRGIALVPEGRGVFPRLSVAENLAMGAFVRDDKAEIANDLERMYGYFPRLKERETQLAGTLSGGEQQMLAIGRALMSRPKLLLLDEPSMGLAPLMVQKIFEVIRIVAAEGMTILLIEQNAKLALQTSQRGYVMESGEITLTGESAQLLDDPKVRAAYLGE